MNIKNLFKEKKLITKSKKLDKTMSEEIASIKTAAQAYNFIKKVFNPDEVLKKTGKTIAVFRKIENEGQVATCIESRNAGVTSLNYRLKFTDETNKEFFEKLIKTIDIPQLICDIIKAPLYGYQPIEICWGLTEDKNYVIPVDITAKPQEWFFFNTDNDLCFDKKGCPDGEVILPESKKFLIPRNQPSYTNPYGKSILSRCFWDVIFKKGSKELWIKFAEKYAMPMLVGKYPDGMSDGEIDSLLNDLENMIQDAVCAIPDNSTIEILEPSTKSASADIYEKLITYADKSIAKAILGQTLTTDSGESGSYALGNVHQQVRQDIIHSDVRLVESQINILLQWINDFNFTGEAPTFEFYSEKGIDKTLAERDKILTETGIKFTKEYYKKTYDLEEDDFELTKTSDTNDFSEGVNKGVNKGQTLSGNNKQYQSEEQKQKMLDDLIDSFSDADLEKIIEPKLKTIIQTFAEKRDMEEVYDELSKLYPEENSKSFEEILSKALFVADLLGSAKNDKN